MNNNNNNTPFRREERGKIRGRKKKTWLSAVISTVVKFFDMRKQ